MTAHHHAPATLTAERFQARLAPTPNGCLEFVGWKDRKGYGLIEIYGKRYLAHRMAWMLLVGPIPHGLCVCHHCDNPPCCNPAHLFLGTVADNNRDARAKGRSRIKPPTGENHPSARLTAVQVADIRLRHASGETQVALAREYGVAPRTIGAVVHRLSWRDVS